MACEHEELKWRQDLLQGQCVTCGELLPNNPHSPLPWRVGRKVGRTVYDANERLIGVMDHIDDAIFLVKTVNAAADRLESEKAGH